MFESAGIKALYDDNSDLLAMLLDVERALNARFYDMHEATRCLILAAMSGESMVMIGPPGTAKSRLIRAFCNLIGLVDEDMLKAGHIKDRRKGRAPLSIDPQPKHAEYFEYLLTQFTEPSELFGFFDLAELQKAKPRLIRQDKNMMQHAKVVFLDEVFNASSAILNSLLTFMNERMFHDRGDKSRVELKLLVAATNQPPSDPALKAVYDRFLLRCWMKNVAGPDKMRLRDDLTNLLQAGWTESHAAELTSGKDWGQVLDKVVAFQRSINTRTADGTLKIDPHHEVLKRLADLVHDMVRSEMAAMSNRRIIKLAAVCLCEALLRIAAQADGNRTFAFLPEDLRLIVNYSRDKDVADVEAKVDQDIFSGV